MSLRQIVNAVETASSKAPSGILANDTVAFFRSPTTLQTGGIGALFTDNQRWAFRGLGRACIGQRLPWKTQEMAMGYTDAFRGDACRPQNRVGGPLSFLVC